MRRRSTVVAWLCQLFDNSWLDFAHYLLFVAAGVAGMHHAPLVWVVAVAGTVSLSSRTDWRALIVKAREVDADYRDFARLMWPHDPLRAFWYFLRGVYLVPFVIATVVGQNLLWSLIAYMLGMTTGWLWDVTPALSGSN